MAQVVEILPCRWQGSIYPTHRDNAMIADDLLMLGTKASAARVVTYRFQFQHMKGNLIFIKGISILVSWSVYQDMAPGGRCKNTYELLNLRALKFLPVNKIHIFQCMGKIFCVEFQRYPLKFRTKYLTHTLKDMIFIQHWNFTSP